MHRHLPTLFISWLAALLAGPASQQTGPAWLNQVLRASGKQIHFTVHGRTTLFVQKEISDPANPRFGLKLVYFAVPAEDYALSVFRVGPDGTRAALKLNSKSEDAPIVLVNGGYYGISDSKTFYPLGLLIHDGHELNKQKDWTSGGMVYSIDGQTRIAPIGSFQISSRVREALQSKPLLVENSQSGIHSDDHQLANRTAVGLRADGTVIIAGAFSPSNSAVTLAEFADFLRAPASAGGAGAIIALNLDGGPSAFLTCPTLNLSFGGSSDLFIPDGIRISAR